VSRSLLAGPAGHPFHPLLVPLPIGAFVSSLIFDILTHTRADGLPYLVDGAFWLIGIGLIGALVAAVFGVLDLRTIPRGTPAFATARTHLALNAATAVVFAIGYSWRAGDHVALDKTRWGQLALSAVAVAFLMAAVWLGGKLTYRYDMRVTRQADHGGKLRLDGLAGIGRRIRAGLEPMHCRESRAPGSCLRSRAPNRHVGGRISRVPLTAPRD
jgi:uncharacterized membrane protein